MPMAPAWSAWCNETLDELHHSELLRSLRPVTPGHMASVTVGTVTHDTWVQNTPSTGEDANRPTGSVRLNAFAANDYLGLGARPDIRSAAAAAASLHGCGPRSSALLGGYTILQRELETSLAVLKQADEALIFPSGYAANLAVLGSIAASERCAIFSDSLNHASIIDGARLAYRGRGAGASLHVYRHTDLTHLDSMLSASSSPLKFIVSDSLFSMDGGNAIEPSAA